jgi:hypothetical protein
MIPPGIQDGQAKSMLRQDEIFQSHIRESKGDIINSEGFSKTVETTDNKIVSIRNEFNVFRIRINETIKYLDIFQGITRR